MDIMIGYNDALISFCSVPTGRLGHVMVTPNFMSADEEDLRSLSIVERDCRFKDEHGDIMRILKEYTRKGCM